MARDERYLAGHPQAWPVIAAYGIVVFGVAAYSVFTPDPGRYKAASTTWAKPVVHPGHMGRESGANR